MTHHVRRFVIAALAGLAAGAAPSAGAAEPFDLLDTWTRDVATRPTTLPRGSWGAGLGLSAVDEFDTLAVGQPLDRGGDLLSEGVSFRYGLTDTSEFTASYRFDAVDFDLEGPLFIGAGYNLARDQRLDVTARARFGWDFQTDETTPLLVGLDAKVLLNERMIIVMPARHLSADFEGEVKPVIFSVPVGFGLQAAPGFYAQLDTELLQWGIRDADDGFIGADFLPLRLLAIYSPTRTLDVGVGVALDARPPDMVSVSDTLAVLASVRYYALAD